MKIVIVADTHTKRNQVIIPECDLLIHAGDFDCRSFFELLDINDWFGKQPARHKVTIMGNHDFYPERSDKKRTKEILSNVHYLENDSIEIEGIKIWGSPYTHIFNDWAFMKSSDKLKENWQQIPDDADIVITHGPAYGINDQLRKANGDLGMNLGCPHLRNKLKAIKPKYHICGHIHEAYGSYQEENTVYINASLMDEYYNLINEPVVINYQ